VITGVPRALTGARASLLGFLAGALNGLIAIGGGIVITPGLIVYARAAPQVAVGSSLAAVVVLSSVAFLVHASFAGLGLDVYAILTVVAAGVAGSQLGGWLLARITAHWLLFLFSAFLLVMSVRLLIQALDVATSLGAEPMEWQGAAPWWSYPVIGFASGILSGVFGVGGGALVLLGFAVLFGMPVREGIPLALLVNVTNALAGCVRHSRAGRVLWREVRRMVPAALVGITLGTAVAIWLPADALRLVFGGFFLFMSAHVARQAMRRRHEDATQKR
jgi:uncharacterized membrane protein YfcA